MRLGPIAIPPLPRGRSSGQSLAEFAIIVPVVLLLLLAIADMGRLYTSAVAVEAAGREAADFGSFDSGNWSAANFNTTVDEMRRRACTAAAGSHLEGYETTDPVNNTTCSNPSFHCTLELSGTTVDCASSGGFVGTTDCSLATTEPPCTVHVEMDYDFRTFLAFPPMPESIAIVRHSLFRVSNLAPAIP
jgi:Flp pilus assembly protein TadG